MTYELNVTGPAKKDIRDCHDWWSENRSEQQADRWLIAIDRAIWSLRSEATRCNLAIEPDLRTAGIRQLTVGLGRRPSHRILFAIEGETVIVYRVRSLAQAAIDIDDLQNDA